MVIAAPKIKKSKNAGNVIDCRSSLSQMLMQMIGILGGKNMNLVERIEEQYSEVSNRLEKCILDFALVLDEGSTITDLTLNRVYSLGSDKLQIIIDELTSVKQTLKEAEMLEAVLMKLEE